MSSRQNCVIFAGMTLSRTDVTNAAMSMLDVVPTYETDRPSASVVEIGKPFDRKLWPILGGAKQRLRVSVVVANARP